MKSPNGWLNPLGLFIRWEEAVFRNLGVGVLASSKAWDIESIFATEFLDWRANLHPPTDEWILISQPHRTQTESELFASPTVNIIAHARTA
jgi:hypothetical protein